MTGTSLRRWQLITAISSLAVESQLVKDIAIVKRLILENFRLRQNCADAFILQQSLPKRRLSCFSNKHGFNAGLVYSAHSLAYLFICANQIVNNVEEYSSSKKHRAYHFRIGCFYSSSCPFRRWQYFYFCGTLPKPSSAKLYQHLYRSTSDNGYHECMYPGNTFCKHPSIWQNGIKSSRLSPEWFHGPLSGLCLYDNNDINCR